MMHTKKSSNLVTVLVGAFVLTGCPEPTNNQDVQGTDAVDTGNTTDTGGGSDVTPTDTQTTDAADDVQATDAGPADAGPSDSGPIDAGAADSGPTTTPLNGCTTFTDLSAGTATIAFAGTAYTPNCIRIHAGQSVTWTGPFSFHPLRAGRAPSRPATDLPSTDPSPITNTDTGTTVTFPFGSAGDYGFYCAIHESFGMYGVVRVE